jgi:hypothetical protein
VLDLYESTIKQEPKTIAKRQAKRKASEPDSESDESDSDVSVRIMEKVNRKKSSQLKSVEKANISRRAKTVKLSSRNKSALKKKSKIPIEEGMEEETAYQKKLEWLKDHGDSDKDEPLAESEGSDEST